MSSKPSSAVPTAVSGVPRLLIVDDEVPMQDLLMLFFRERGFAAQACAAASECLRSLEAFAPQAVVLDVHLASEDGLQLVSEIKRVRPGTGVVMFTGMGIQPDLVGEALQRGADGYVSKGGPLDELLLALNRVIPCEVAGNPPSSVPSFDCPCAAGRQAPFVRGTDKTRTPPHAV
jgi:ActR/RegA family two-component response regulator